MNNSLRNFEELPGDVLFELAELGKHFDGHVQFGFLFILAVCGQGKKRAGCREHQYFYIFHDCFLRIEYKKPG
jgi:hypothetical protein